MKMLLAAGLRIPNNQAGTSRLRVQVEFIKQGLHALAEWRTYHAAIPRDLVVDAISQLIRAGLLAKGHEHGPIEIAETCQL
jgi:hypothetical protein